MRSRVKDSWYFATGRERPCRGKEELQHTRLDTASSCPTNITTSAWNRQCPLLWDRFWGQPAPHSWDCSTGRPTPVCIGVTLRGLSHRLLGGHRELDEDRWSHSNTSAAGGSAGRGIQHFSMKGCVSVTHMTSVCGGGVHITVCSI